MANVFISYERSDEATARKLINALESGHEVWSDALIPPHRDYGDVITEQLKAAEVVLVLWSQTAANSQWVRAEADYAREHGKLVQVVLDTSIPPLPFNRIQFARMRGWKGDATDPEWRKVLASIEQLSTGSVAPTLPRTAVAVEAKWSSGYGRSVRIVGAAVAIAIAAAAWWFVRGPSVAVQSRDTRVAVLPFDTLSADENARYFAESLTDQILTTLSSNHIPVVSRADAAALRGPNRDKKLAEFGVARLFDGTVRNDGDKIDVKVHLEDPRQHAVLWSKQVDGAASDATQLQDRIATAIATVVACSNRALRPVNGLSDPAVLARYLHACDVFANRDIRDPQASLEMLAAFREVTVQEPNFAAAHSDLAFLDAILADAAPPEQAASMRQEAASEAERALAIERKSPDAYVARAYLLPQNQWAEREKLLREGVAIDPEWARTNAFLAYQLIEVGRLTDARSYMRKAAAADLQTDVTGDNAFIEAAAGGETGPCIEIFSRLVDVDGMRSAWGNLLRCQGWAGHTDAALAMLAAPSAPTAGTRLNDAWIAFIGAAKTRAPADIANARKLAIATAAENGLGMWSAVQDLAYLGLVDDAFALVENYTQYDDVTFEFLFFPPNAPLRKDPRFMKLAARVGLVDYWTKSGHWPDFCSEPGLPYNCQDEAARLGKS